MTIFPLLSNDVLEKIIQIKANLIDFIFSSDEIANKAYLVLFLSTVNNNFEIKADEIEKEMASLNQMETSSNIIKEKFNVVELLDLLISWFPNEVSKNWTKMTALLFNVISVILKLHCGGWADGP